MPSITKVQSRNILLFGLLGPTVITLPLALVFVVAGLGDHNGPVMGLIPLLFGTAMGIVPALVTGAIFEFIRIARTAKGLPINFPLVGLVAGALSATVFALGVDYLLVLSSRHAKPASGFLLPVFFGICGAIGGSACGAIAKR